jgi:UPF0755 protein
MGYGSYRGSRYDDDDDSRSGGLRGGALISTLIFSLIAFACGFGATTGGLAVTQPMVPGATNQITFQVNPGDTSKEIANNLKTAGLIRNSTIFFYYAHYIKKLDSSVQEGVYKLSPGETMDQIIKTLETSTPLPQISVTVIPGLRILEYPDLFSKMSKFNKDNFLKIATTGVYTDGSTVNKKFWFVPPLHKDAKYALEGYLYPDTYSFNQTDDERKVIDRMLTEFGEKICPGPDTNLDAFWPDPTSCAAHAIKVGPDTAQQDIFTVAKAKYFDTDNVTALYDALTLGSIVIRESSQRDNNADAPQIADILYRRFLVEQGKLGAPGSRSDYSCLDTDPATWYGYYNDPANTLAAGASYWDPVGSPSKVAAQSPYNTYTQCHGLPPGPISAPVRFFLKAALDPNLGKITTYFFYLHDNCTEKQGFPHFYPATYLYQQQSNGVKYLNKCPNPGA